VKDELSDVWSEEARGWSENAQSSVTWSDPDAGLTELVGASLLPCLGALRLLHDPCMCL
jgi:hypothetical protein